VTLGFGEIIRILMRNLDRPVNITNGAKGITGVDTLNLFGLKFSGVYHWFGLKSRAVAVVLPADAGDCGDYFCLPAPAAFAHWPRLARHP
jgi:hypothetical protein